MPAIRIPVLIFCSVMTLASCSGVARDQCQRAAVNDIRTLDQLIAEAEANLARGYRFDRHAQLTLAYRRCGAWSANNPSQDCLYGETDIVHTPKAIDEPAEARKIRTMKVKRMALIPQAMAHLQACRGQDHAT